MMLEQMYTRKCTIAADSHIDRITISVTKYDYFCKPITITLNIILYEFIVSRLGLYGHTINILPSEYINSETMSPILIFVMKQDKYIIVGLKCPSYS